MHGLRPLLDLMRQRVMRPLVRLQARHLDALAPADMHMALALRLADLERR